MQPTARSPLPQWVEVLPAGELAIVVRERRGSVCIRYASRRGAYHWLDRSALTRRPDLDRSPDPEWLATARASMRPSPILWPLLGIVPWPADDEHCRADDLADAAGQDGDRPAPMFETDERGRPKG